MIYFKIIKEYDEFASLENDWKKIINENREENFYFSYEWFYAQLNLVKSRPNNLYIIIAYENGLVVGIIPLTIINKKLRLFRYQSLEIIGNAYSAYRGCVVSHLKENEVADALVDFLWKDKNKDWDVFDFSDLLEHDKFMQLIVTRLENIKAVSIKERLYPNIVIDLESYSDGEQFFRELGNNVRQNIRTKINKIRRYGDAEITLTSLEEHNLNKTIWHYYEIYDKSWKISEEDSEFHDKLATYLVDKGRLRIFILYFKPTIAKENKEKNKTTIETYQSKITSHDAPPDYIPIASFYSVIYGRKVFFLKTAYREEYAHFSPGVVLMWFVCKYLIEAEQVSLLDCQRGDEAYKYRFNGKFNSYTYKFRGSNPECFKANIELWCEKEIIPILRKVKRFIRIGRTFT